MQLKLNGLTVLVTGMLLIIPRARYQQLHVLRIEKLTDLLSVDGQVALAGSEKASWKPFSKKDAM